MFVIAHIAPGDTVTGVADLELTAVYEPVEGGWVQARITEMPGVITAGPDAQSARELLADALVEYMASF